MRRLLIALGLLLLALLLLYPLAHAFAHDDGRYSNANPEMKAWVKGLKSRASGSMGCCDISDGSPPEAAWDMGGGRYQVVIDGKSYDVPAEALITEPNRLGYAVVWFSWTTELDGTRTPMIRCFLPGAGG